MIVSGIYKIVNTINGKFYIGRAKNINKRISEHKYNLRRGKHVNPKLQNAWNKHGESNFKFDILLLCPEEELVGREQEYLSSSKSSESYILNFSSETIEFSAEIRAKMSAAKKGKCSGANNNNYKPVSPIIKDQARKIWIKYGRNKLIEFMLENGFKSGVSRRLISEFSSEPESLSQRKQNNKKMRQSYGETKLRDFTGRFCYSC